MTGFDRLAACLLCTALTWGQETCRLQVDGAEHGFRVHGAAGFTARGRSVQAELPAGEWRFAFAAGAGARPGELVVIAPAGGEVVVAVGRGPAPRQEPWYRDAGEHEVPVLLGGEDDRDLRVAADVRPGRGGIAGVCARWRDETHHYRLVLDGQAAEVRLERQLGAHVLVLARQPVAGGDRWHRLELQVEGFRLHAMIDEMTLARAMDGALSQGRYGTFASGGEARFARLEAWPPAVPGMALAASRGPGRLEVRAQAPAAVDHVHALALRLDRPVPLWPTTWTGAEPFLLQPPAEPWLAAPFAFGVVSPRGDLAGTLMLPQGTLLAGHAALVSGLLGSPDGALVLDRLPAAAVRFPASSR